MSPDDIALFRFHLIAEALNPHLTQPSRAGWCGIWPRVPTPIPTAACGLNTFDRCIRAHRERGLDGL